MNADLTASLLFLLLATGAALRPLRPTTAQAIRRARDRGNAWLAALEPRDATKEEGWN